MELRKQIRRFIGESFFVDSFADQDSFLGTGIIDSMGMMQLVAYLEQELQVPIVDADLVPANLDSLERVCAFVERKRAEQAQRRLG